MVGEVDGALRRWGRCRTTGGMGGGAGRRSRCTGAGAGWAVVGVGEQLMAAWRR